MNITIIGCGRWGSFLTWYFDSHGENVTVYGRENSKSYNTLKDERKNEYVTLSENVRFTSDLKAAIEVSDKIIVSIGAQNTPDLFYNISKTDYKDKTFILCMKGLIESDGSRLSEVAKKYLGRETKIAVWVGPGHVEDYTKGIPNCMLICSEDIALAKKLCDEFSTELIRFYYSSDMIGNEIGAATKNVMGIAAGMLDGLSLSTLKGALMARGTCEIASLVGAMGGDERSIYGLSHLGDYEATLFSAHSHNRMFGEDFIKGVPYDRLAEGVSTLAAVMVLKEKYGVELPICTALYKLIYQNADPNETMKSLFFRPQKGEFSSNGVNADLVKKEERKFANSAVMEGIVSIKAVIAANEDGVNNRKIQKVLFDEQKREKKQRELQYLEKKSKALGFEIEFCISDVIDKYTTGTSHGGVIAFCSERTLKTLDMLNVKKDGFYVMIEGIEDPYNFGYALRSVYASGADAVILSPRNWLSAAGVVARSSAGASERFDVYVSNGADAADFFKSKGFTVAYADEDAEHSVYDADLKAPLFLLVGGEKRGISSALRQKCDLSVKLEYGRKFDGALSAASAASILAFEVYRQNK